jgi:hypothetical protein
LFLLGGLSILPAVAQTGHGSTAPAPPNATDYRLRSQHCPQANGRSLYQIKLTYQSNAGVAQYYWYTPGTLNFITLQGKLNKTPLSSIDRATFRLNHDCGVNFEAPRYAIAPPN